MLHSKSPLAGPCDTVTVTLFSQPVSDLSRTQARRRRDDDHHHVPGLAAAAVTMP